MRALQELFNRLKELAEEGYAESSFVIDSATMRDVSAFVRKGGLVGKALLGSSRIKINFRARENTWGGDIFVPLSSSGMEEHVVGFDSDRLYACFATARKGEEMSVEEREGKWVMSDGKNRTWTHTLVDSSLGSVTPTEDLESNVGEIKLFYDKQYAKLLLEQIKIAEKEAKKEDKKYDDIIFVTEGTDIVLCLYGEDKIEIDRKDTEYERGASVSIYPLEEFKTVLKAMKAKGATEGLKIYFAPEKLMRLIFPIQKGKGDVIIAPKLDPKDETFGEFFPELFRKQLEAERRDIMEEKQDRHNCLLARGLIVNKDAPEVGRIARLERSESGKLFYLIIEKGKWATDTKKTAYKQLENAKRRFRWLTQKEVEEK